MFSANSLTPRQAEIIDFLQELRREGKNAPTYREIAAHFGFKSPKAAADHVRALEKKGYVRRQKGRSRGIELLFSEKPSTNGAISVPLIGNISAGYPETQTEYQHGTLAVDPAILDGSTGHRLFALRVNGESMTGRGIHEGDWVVADADASPRKGDVVIALIDGENTLKTLAGHKDGFFLKAESPFYSDLIPTSKMDIQGVVRAVLRRIY